MDAPTHEMQSLMQTLLARSSTPPRLMGDDGPTDAEVQDLLAAAVTAPDHGAIRPWRFVVIQGDDRARLGQVFADALKARDPAASPEALQKELDRPLRAHTLIAVLARITPDRPNVPPVEQIVATACAAQNILLAAEAKGLGAIMLTGKNAQDAHVKRFFGLGAADEIVAFVYLGKAAGPIPQKERPNANQFVEPFGAYS